MDNWNPKQYEKFKDQRAQPFWDLLNLIKPPDGPGVLDLGCGTGELTRALHERLGAGATLGIDSSSKMLTRSKGFASEKLSFAQAGIENFTPDRKYDVVFSNAALQWVDNHETLFPKILSWAADQGQIAVQMPCNFDHVSHRLAADVAHTLFPSVFTEAEAPINILNLERYAELLFRNGFVEQSCSIRVYGHPMASGYDLVEWTKGTLLTRYEGKLSTEEFTRFVDTYARELIRAIGDGPYFYGFKRMLLWGKKNNSKY